MYNILYVKKAFMFYIYTIIFTDEWYDDWNLLQNNLVGAGRVGGCINETT